ncbi:MAG: peptidoglycan D,D-transpeptidase FtsI family protein [Microgenomates group bacterium]
MIKIKLLFICFFLLYLAIIFKLFLIQIVHPVPSGKDIYLHTNKIYPERGKIFDRNLKPLALNQNSYQLFIEPKKIEDKKKTIESLSRILEIPEASLASKLDEKKYWIAIAAGIERRKKEEIESLKLPGIGFNYQMKRFYPEASLSAHLLGFMGKNKNNEDVGYFGIEGFYDKDLAGLPGFLQSERDLLGRPILVGTQEKVIAENGRNLVLTLDKTVQEISKRRLNIGLERYKAKQGCVITAAPETMEILGLVCLPDYDPDKYYQFNEAYFKNPVISEVFEPGSIFKPLVMAAAIEEKKIKPTDYYNEVGPIEIGEYKIRTWNNKYEGRISMTRILEKSSNVGMVYVGEKLGNNNLLNYLKKYGFGEVTKIDLQGEISGYLKPLSNWYPIDFATVAFGQGIAVTPIQMITAFSSIVNGGKLMRPYVVSEIFSQTEKKIIKPKMVRRVISERTSEIIKKMLKSTVENGEIKWAKPQGYSIGGKTGTAQIPIKGHYDPSKTIASFIGFFPVGNPKLIILVMLREPQTSPWGSETAAPLFFEIAKELIVYYNIAPDQ